MLRKGQTAQYNDIPLPEEASKGPYILEFLNLKDEEVESDLEEASINHLETFLLELVMTFASWDRSGATVLLMNGVGRTWCSIT